MTANEKPPSSSLSDTTFMRMALDEARKACARDEVPIGAVVVLDGEVLARAHNRTRCEGDPTSHAELLALREAFRSRAESKLRGGPGMPRLEGAQVYTTVEPCFMCAGALVHARVERVIWAVRDPKFGGAASLGQTLSHPGLNHKVELHEGVLAEEARTLLQEFFRARRKRTSAC